MKSRGRHRKRRPAPPLTTGRITPLIVGQPDPAMRRVLQGVAEGLRDRYGDDRSTDNEGSSQ